MCRMIQEDKSSEAVVADENAKTEKISEKGMVIRMQQNADLNVNTLTNTTYREDDKVVGTRSAKSSPTRRVGTVTFGITAGMLRHTLSGAYFRADGKIQLYLPVLADRLYTAGRRDSGGEP